MFLKVSWSVVVPGGQLLEVDCRQQDQRVRTHARQTSILFGSRNERDKEKNCCKKACHTVVGTRFFSQMTSAGRLFSPIQIQTHTDESCQHAVTIYLIFYWIARILFLGFLVLVWHVQILHVGGEGWRDGDARKDAHHGSKDQHESHHHTLHIMYHDGLYWVPFITHLLSKE